MTVINEVAKKDMFHCRQYGQQSWLYIFLVSDWFCDQVSTLFGRYSKSSDLIQNLSFSVANSEAIRDQNDSVTDFGRYSLNFL